MAIEARWNGTIIARSANTVVVEGNHYFPREDVRTDFFEESQHATHCPWKGDAAYYSLVVAGERNENAGWYYPEPKQAASEIADRIAFWNGVEVTETQ